MSHRFSNSTKTRQEILQRAAAPVRWEDIPQDMRITILEHISQCVEEVISEPSES